jgi:membrane protease YdiL (CAAX protease family)
METLSALVQALIIILFAGGFALLAQWGRKNRSAEITLIVLLLALSSLVFVLGTLVALVGLSDMVPDSQLSRELSLSSAAVILLASLAGFALCVAPLRKITGRRAAGNADTAKLNAGDLNIATNPPSEERYAQLSRFSRGWYSDPPVYFALWLLVFVVIAFLGVGLGVRRGFRQTLARLGYGPITLRQVGIVTLFIVGALLLSFFANALFSTLQPELFERVGRISEGLFGTEGFSLVSTILFALLVGVGAALGEETLFRGALQPALGIPLTSVLWAFLHIQYGPSILLVFIFVLSIGLGILRNRVNTTATFLAHAGYNASSVLLAYFFSV